MLKIPSFSLYMQSTVHVTIRIVLGHCTLILTLFPLRSSFFLSLAAEIMASFNRGQPPARQTKMVHHGFGCIKAGSTGLGPDCRNDDIYP